MSRSWNVLLKKSHIFLIINLPAINIANRIPYNFAARLSPFQHDKTFQNGSLDPHRPQLRAVILWHKESIYDIVYRRILLAIG